MQGDQQTIYLNRIRIMAGFFVVALHVCAQFFGWNEPSSANFIISVSISCLTRTCVPLFFFVSGAIYLNENKQMSYKKLLLTILRFVAIFLLWDLLYKFFDVFVMNHSKFDFNAIKGILKDLTQYKYHLWYLPAYISAIALVPVLKLICKKENRSQIRYLLIIFAIGAGFIEMIRFWVSLSSSSNGFVSILKHFLDLVSILNFGNITSWCIMLISGWYFSTFDFKKYLKFVTILKYILLILLPAVIITISAFTLKKELFDTIFESFYLPAYALTICFFLSFRYGKFSNKQNVVLDYVGRVTFPIYLIHIAVLELVFVYTGWKDVLVHSNSFWLILFIPCIIVLIYIISMIVSILLYFIPKKIRKWIC